MDIPKEIAQLEALLPYIRTEQAHQLRRQFFALKRERAPSKETVLKLKEQIVQSASETEARLNAFPELNYQTELPIYQAREEIIEALKSHQVLIVCGETGSGKTTQLSKFCLEMGLGARGTIGHTQPRRLAALSVAERIAEELDTPLGDFVGYKMRFNEEISDKTVLKLMTDGILLTELMHDRYLNQYEVIIIDEAHERSLNIDFLLGILKKILPRRPDLKLIITSATIDPETFSNYFGGPKKAPIIEVSGRTYPVEIRYRDLHLDEENDPIEMEEGIIAAVNELQSEKEGDILIFLPGEREILETADLLRKEFRHYDILPLFSRLSQAEQKKIFSPKGRSRIVLSTNVAETSITVPRIRYVIDTGVARVSRYNARSRIQSLLIEPISQAAANQRSGRCGRVAEGIAIRLYSEEDFNSRPLFLDPEILRTHLASVILQMGHLRLGHPEEFPFVEMPEMRQIREGFQTLKELKAVNDEGRLTPLGRTLAKIPIDSKLGAMIIQGEKEGVGHEVLALVAGLSIQDPRERPLEFQQQADEKHRLFRQERSDFITLLNLWAWYQDRARRESQNQMRKVCRAHFLNFMRMREWYDLYQQLKGIYQSLSLKWNPFPKSEEKNQPKGVKEGEYLFPSFSEDQIHRAILVGSLDQIGELGEEKLYSGANGRKFKIFPGSALYRKPPKWIMSLEIVETSQVFARMNAAINPEWLERLAEHLLKREYTEPHWSKQQGQAAAYETVRLFNLAIIKNRTVSFGRIKPEISRELLIREGLVEGEIQTRAPFYRVNRKTISKVAEMEEKTRRRDILIEEWKLFEWYNERLPQDIYSVASLEKWCKNPKNNQSLIFSESDILDNDEQLNLEDFPTTISFGQLRLNAVYRFDPAAEDDGMTLMVPLAALNLLDKTRLDWLVPGLLREKITEILRSLPRALRKNFVPLPNVVDEMLEKLSFGEGNLYFQIAAFLTRRSGIKIEPHLFDENLLDKHLRINIRVIDTGGKTIAEGRDLQQLTQKLRGRAENAFQQLASSFGAGKKEKKARNSEEKGAKEDAQPRSRRREDNSIASDQEAKEQIYFSVDQWKIALEERFVRNGIELKGYPALLIDKEQPLTLRKQLYDRPHAAQEVHLNTLVTLILKTLHEQVKYLRRQWPQFGKLALMFRQVGNEELLREDLMRAIIKDRLEESSSLPRDAAEFQKVIEKMRREMVSDATDLSRLIVTIFERVNEVREALNQLHPMNRALAEKRIKAALDRLIYPDFISQTPKIWRDELPRFLEAMVVRIERFSQNITRDNEQNGVIEQHWQNYLKAQKFFADREELPAMLEEYRWMIEEMAVSFFAQPMRTKMTVSEKRLNKLWDEIDLLIKNSSYH
ncbi:ATP-dependent helicase [Ignatzschineria indica]|uniref:ATP-dependent RNA helicase HrpA n=1 Tax=Ignatzschineria indica TaxID=472583 RepID=A0A2U2AM26_9GAMM|nr:ATP-dependent RNA helicase HrpA [Ignatzschineria indica]PWD84272.1 ATP-dependent RNA helicase HrpA [Ignatzschineria indica]GGZ75200.1 ATP-dependent helicase [Ignatzschineria indica]